MKPLPTDLQILNEIYDRYYNEFAFHAARREKKNIVRIEIESVARALGVDADIVFGRLYYHLDHKYRYPRSIWGLDADQDADVRLFLPKTEFGFDGVHFSFLASVLAEMRAEDRKQRTSTNIAWYSLAVSTLAVFASILISVFT